MQAFGKIIGALTLLFFAICAGGQSSPNFTGHWQQQTNSATQRQLEIEQNGNNLLVRTININSQGTKRLEVKYEIGGPPTSYTALDGDEFRSSVHWDSGTLVFDITEHEGGKDIPQKTVWTLSADGNTIQVDRESTKTVKPTHSLTTYIRQH